MPPTKLKASPPRVSYPPLVVALPPADAYTLAMWLHTQAECNATLPDGIAALYRKAATALAHAAKVSVATVDDAVPSEVARD